MLYDKGNFPQLSKQQQTPNNHTKFWINKIKVDNKKENQSSKSKSSSSGSSKIITQNKSSVISQSQNNFLFQTIKDMDKYICDPLIDVSKLTF